MGIVVKSNLDIFSPNDWQNVINLELIYADSNKIAELGTFNGLKNLQQVSLRSNKLTIIQEGTFVGTDKLRIIDLKFNEIHTIEDGAFDTPSLETLDLNRNKLTKLSDLVFSKTPKLISISISNNKLIHIGRSLFSLSNIVNINLNRNTIEDIDLTAFSKLRRLKFLRLQGSGFSFDLSKEMKIVQNTSDENTSLEDLDIRNNNLSNAYDLYELHIFKGLKNLWLSGNAYTDFEFSAEEIRYILPNLNVLNLDGQKLWCEDLSLLQQQLQQLNIALYRSQSCCACIN